MSQITNQNSRSRASATYTHLTAAVVLLSAAAALAQPTVIDFEDIAAPATISAQYGARGVVFDRAYLSRAPFFNAGTVAHSGTRVLRSDNPINEFHNPPLVFTFTSPQRRVKFFAGCEVTPVTGTLTAKDPNGTVVATDGPRQVTPNVFNTAFEVTLTTANITRVEFLCENLVFEAIDDLEFEGEAPPPPPAQPPVVTISQPPNGADLDLQLINIAGTVTGESLLPIVTVRIDWRRPPESQAPVFTSTIPLTGTGTTRQFLLEGFSGLPLGPITITAEAENTGGLKGTATSTITNLPAGIRNRFINEGGAAALGAFRFGTGGAGCQIAVYEQAAISVDAVGVTHVVRGAILGKWLSLRTQANPGGLGCPIGDERGASIGTSQDFTGGRIYTGTFDGTVYVPAVFVDAIEKRGGEFANGEFANGVPTSDPVMPVEPVTHTWLYQRFRRADLKDPNTPNDPNRPLLTTLEIRGNPPRLWLERQSGDRSVETSGTIWESFPCSGNQGPCSVEPTPPQPMAVTEPGNRFCEGTTYPWGPPEWKAILGDHISTPVFGVVRSSHMADVDNVFTHEWSYNCPFETVRPDCPSDWLMRIRPYGPHRGVAPYSSLFAGTSRDTLKIEYERFYGEFAGWMGFPAEHDLFFGAGRWIIDCGHDTYKSEFHPIFMYCKMKTITELVDPFTGIADPGAFNGQPATQADIWVNGWYPGDPIEFDIFPPPRPTPTATLVVNKPVDADAVFGVNLEYSLQPAEAVSHVHIKFTAPYREAKVTSAGEMIWDINRGYEGQWYLYWAP